MRLLARGGLVATIEASADQLERISGLATELPELRVVVDHFGWPDDFSPEGRRLHLERLGPLAALASVATRLDALGTIFGAWDGGQGWPNVPEEAMPSSEVRCQSDPTWSAS